MVALQDLGVLENWRIHKIEQIEKSTPQQKSCSQLKGQGFLLSKTILGS